MSTTNIAWIDVSFRATRQIELAMHRAMLRLKACMYIVFTFSQISFFFLCLMIILWTILLIYCQARKHNLQVIAKLNPLIVVPVLKWNFTHQRPRWDFETGPFPTLHKADIWKHLNLIFWMLICLLNFFCLKTPLIRFYPTMIIKLGLLGPKVLSIFKCLLMSLVINN